MRSLSWLSLFGAVAFASFAMAQESPFTVHQEITFECAFGRSIPDPTDVLALASFVRNESIAKELRLSDDQKKELNSLIKASSGSLSTVFVQVVGDQLPSEEELDRQMDEVKNERAIAFEAILDPLQRDRLQQIAYHIEVERVGIVAALTNGFLGQGVGIEDYQKGPLEIVASTLLAELVARTESNQQLFMHKLASELTEDEQAKLQETLGKTFVYRDDVSLQRFERMGTLRSGKQAAIPDPSSIVALVAFLENEYVAKELGLQPKQVREVSELHENARGPLVSAGRRHPALKSSIDAEIKDKVSCMLSGQQQLRLRQIAYQIEISRVGFAESLATGFLGEAVGGSAKRREMLSEKCSGLEQENQNKIKQLTNIAIAKILSELTGVQQEKAAKLLGSHFDFRETLRRQL